MRESAHVCAILKFYFKINVLVLIIIKKLKGVLVVAQWKQIQLVSVRMLVRSLASPSGLEICHCHELWCRSQMPLRSGVAVAVVWAYTTVHGNAGSSTH